MALPGPRHNDEIVYAVIDCRIYQEKSQDVEDKLANLKDQTVGGGPETHSARTPSTPGFMVEAAMEGG